MKITVLGAGAWGTAIALLLARKGHEVIMWCYEDETSANINTEHENKQFFSGVPLPSSIKATTSLAHALTNDLIFQAIPVPFMRSVLNQCVPFVRPSQMWCSLSKGIENQTLLFPSAIIKEILGEATPVAILSGPSFAQEVADHEPTIATIVAENHHFCEKVKELVQEPTFCCTTSLDIQGVQCASALKNVIALGSGLLAGIGYHCNTQVFFLLQCIEEIKPLIIALGGSPQTIYGPAGIGDLVLTCFGKQSRNYSYGLEFGTGLGQNQKNRTVEGINTLFNINELAYRHNIELPLCFQLREIFFDLQPPAKLIKKLCKNMGP